MRITVLGALAAFALIGCGGQQQAVRWNSGRTNELSQYIATRGEPNIEWSVAELDRYDSDLRVLGALNDGAKQAELNHLRTVSAEVRKLKQTRAFNTARVIADHKALVAEVMTRAQMADPSDVKATESVMKAVLHLLAQNEVLGGLPGATEVDRRMLDQETAMLIEYRQALIAQVQKLRGEAKLVKDTTPNKFTI